MQTNPILDHDVLKTQYRDYLREIEQERLYQQFTANRPKPQNRLWLKLAGGLTSLGQTLKSVVVTRLDILRMKRRIS
jgi:hypothetical protein